MSVIVDQETAKDFGKALTVTPGVWKAIQVIEGAEIINVPGIGTKRPAVCGSLI